MVLRLTTIKVEMQDHVGIGMPVCPSLLLAVREMCEEELTTDSDYIVAVNSDQQNGSCGKKIKVTNTKTGKTATALAADTCMSLLLYLDISLH